MNLMGKATLLLALFVVFLSSPLLIVASRSSFDAKTTVMRTNLSEVEGEEKAAAAVDGSKNQAANVGTSSSHGRKPPSVAKAAASAGATAWTSARQVPTGPDPIHHHQSPVRH